LELPIPLITRGCGWHAKCCKSGLVRVLISTLTLGTLACATRPTGETGGSAHATEEFSSASDLYDVTGMTSMDEIRVAWDSASGGYAIDGLDGNAELFLEAELYNQKTREWVGVIGRTDTFGVPSHPTTAINTTLVLRGREIHRLVSDFANGYLTDYGVADFDLVLVIRLVEADPLPANDELAIAWLPLRTLLAEELQLWDSDGTLARAKMRLGRGVEIPAATSPGGSCGCYFSDECEEGAFCDYNSCDVWYRSDKTVDGVCRSARSVSRDQAPAVAEALDGYLLAYREAVAKQGGGPPDPELWGRALSTTSDAWRLELPGVAATVLDVTLGFDFMHPNARLGLADRGAIRSVEDRAAAGALLDAVRAGLRAQILGDPEMLPALLRVFWQEHPTYHPMHTGRCWNHGHPDHPYASPEECQVDSLSRLFVPVH
jgi:hypothetical protein